MTGSTATLLIDDSREGLLSIALNRPGRLNAMTRGMVRELHTVLGTAQSDPDLRVVLITGEGDRGFCPGLDLQHDGSLEEPLAVGHFQVVTMLHEMPAVTVAAINGACAGAGLGWALACDFRLMVETAKLNSAFLDVGVAGDMGVPWFLTRLVGASRAREVSMLRAKFGSQAALELGLVNRVFPGQTFREQVKEFIDLLLTKPPRALRTLKANYVDAERLSLANYVELEAERHQGLLREIGPLRR